MAALAGIGLVLIPAPQGVPSEVLRSAGVIVLVVGLWATGVVPEYFTAVLFFFLALTLAGQPPEVVFSGFSASATWLVFGGLVIGFAVQTTGLGSRIAQSLVGYFSGSYLNMITRTVLVSALMAFVLPSNMGRIVIMLPIFLGLGERLGFGEGSRGRAGVTMAVGAGTMYPSFGILTAAVPNLVLLGSAESIYGMQMTYGQYLVMQFPVISITSVIALPIFIRILFPDVLRLTSRDEELKPWSTDERKLLTILLTTLGLWILDFAHGISPAWIALGAALVCLMPRIGVIPPTSLVNKINLGPWLLLAGVIGMGTVAAKSGLGDLIGRFLLSIAPFDPANDLGNFISFSAIAVIVGILVTVPGQPAIMTVLAEKISTACGWPLLTVIMALVPSWIMTMFPYQVPPMIIAAQLGGLRMAQVMRLMLAMALLGWVVILPLQFLWWRFLGYFG